MRSERACLGSLSPTTGDLLGLRAGLDGPPLSRSAAASQLGISRRSAARLERSGLRALHVACGGSGGGNGGSTGTASARVASLAGGAPVLQPAVYLPVASAPSLQPAPELNKPRGKQQVEGTTATSPSGGGRGPVSAAATSDAIGNTSGGALPIIMAACLATLAALALVGLRRRAVVMQRRGPTVTAAVLAPPVAEPSAPAAAPVPVVAPQPDVGEAGNDAPDIAAPDPTVRADAADSSEPTGWPGPSADAHETVASEPTPRDTSRLTRSATVVASSVVSFAVRELLRRRRGR